MKYFLLNLAGFIVLFVNSHHQAYAQSVEEPVLKNTIHFSLGSSNYTIYGSQVDLEASYPGSNSYVERRKGFRFDVEFRQELSKDFFVQEGISYVQKGGYHKSTPFVDPARAEISYLQLPFQIGLKSNTPKVSLGIYGGVAVNIQLSSEDTTTGSGWLNDSYDSKFVIPSLIVGGFFDVSISKKAGLNLSFKHDRDLTPLVERSLNGKEYEIRLKGYSLTAGLRFTVN